MVRDAAAPDRGRADLDRAHPARLVSPDSTCGRHHASCATAGIVYSGASITQIRLAAA
jgi:hypothetical protein